MESEFSGKILLALLDEQVKLLAGEINECKKQLEMINIIKENIRDEATDPANTILGIEDIMEKKKSISGKKKLTLIHIVVVIAAILGFMFMVWLVVSRIWWGLALYVFFALFGLSLSAFQLKDAEFICPKCDSAFKPALNQAFFSTGNNKIRWMACPECGHKDWCVIRKQKQAS